MKILDKTDYRRDIWGVDKYGRRKCSRCDLRRKVNVWWRDTDVVLCKECSNTPDVAFNYSIR